MCYGAVNIIRVRLRVDDSLDVFAVHGVGGILGILALPALSAPSLGGTGDGVFGVQLVGTLAVVAWSAVATAAILLVLKLVMGLRVDDEAEAVGLDMTLHGENAYD